MLFMYDAIVTFDREVASFWTAKRTGTAVLYFANKWISMAVYVAVLISHGSMLSDKASSSVGSSVPCRMSKLTGIP